MGVLYEVGSGGGHTMQPAPAAGVTEKDVVDAINTGVGDGGINDDVASLYGIGVWSNIKTFRRVLVNGTGAAATIGSRGIGTWDDSAVLTKVVSPTGNPATRGWYEVNTTTHFYQVTSDTSVVADKAYYSAVPVGEIAATDGGWWYDAAFVAEDDSDDVDVSIKFDPSGDTIALGGYMLDTTTGRICIKFANSVTPSTAKIAVDVTHTRNEYS